MYMTIVPSVHTRKQAFDTIHRQKSVSYTHLTLPTKRIV